MEKQQKEVRRDGVQQAKQQAQLNPAGSPAPLSPSSSPSHEFSFTISLDIPPDNSKTSKSSPSPPPFAAVDLSPADEIFFHGHLLPLHLLSHLPTSPRASMDSFTLPIKELLLHDKDCSGEDGSNNNNKTSSTRSTSDEDDDNQHESRHVLEGKNRGKSKSFSLFGNMPKWKKLGFESKEAFDDQQQNPKSKSKSKSRFEFLKRYMGFVMPFLSNSGKGDREFRRGRYSYSGNLRFRSKKDLRGRRGEFSAPATMRTSPANSGILMTASGTVTPTTSKSDSTMEELQAAIQAAIAHCKKSIATEDQNQAAMKL